ncbi:MAG: helix-turn-helix domain-containing protein [Ferruginibacter sp.]
MQKIYIKGMVCHRCISTVKSELESIGLQLEDINLGEITLSLDTEITDLNIISEQLKPFGFSLLEDKNARLVSDVKQLVAEIYGGDFDFPEPFRFSTYISKKLQRDYDSISSLFSMREKVSLEKYMLDFRIEKTKEFLVYTPQTQSDIAFRLGFSSVAHLSRQFKTFTGFNPSYYKALQTAKKQISNEVL